MSDKVVMIWEVVVVFEVQDIYTVDNGPHAMKQLYKTRRNTKRKRYFTKPDGEDIANFLSNFLNSRPIISVEVNQYQTDLKPIELEESE